MSVITITEYAEIHPGLGGKRGQVPVEPPLASQAIDIAGSSQQSAPFNAKTQLVRINVDVATAIEIGTNPTATLPSGGLGSGRMSANASEFRAVPLNGGFMVAFIATT